jgi:hypothetical protein
VVSVFMVAATVTIVPAMAALWYFLRRYEGYFQDARVFFSLVVGFFAGLAVAFLENVLFRFQDQTFIEATGLAFALMYFIFGYAMLESAAKLVVLGSKNFRVRKDTPYYGAALGLGFGAMVSLQIVALALQGSELLTRGLSGSSLAAFLLLVLTATGTCLTHGAAGVWIGKGAADGKLWRGLLHGTLWQAPALLTLWFLWVNLPTIAIVPALASALFGAIALLVAQTRILDRIVPPEIRDLVRKERRREQRSAARGERDGRGPDEPLVTSPLDPPPRP